MVDLLLPFIRVLSLAGCKLIRPDGNEVELDGTQKFEGDKTIADNESPRLLYNYTTEGITNIVKGMA